MTLNNIWDPDYYYHVSLTKEIFQNGFPETLPQVKGAGWDVLFTDKEFFFHVLTTFAYFLGGEKGIQVLPSLLSLGTLVLLCAHSALQIGKKLFWLPLLFVITDPHFLYRSILVRPHVLAIFLFTAFLLAVHYRRKYMCLVICAFYALSYHTLQIPLLFCFILLTTFGVSDKKIKDCVLASVFGLIIGILVNPYFPGNLLIIQQILQILSLSHSSETLNFGSEILPFPNPHLYKYSLLTFFTVLFSTFHLGKIKLKDADSRLLFSYLLFVLFFLSLSFWTPRAREYVTPLLIMLFIQNLKVGKNWLYQETLSLFKFHSRKSHFLMALLILVCTVQISFFANGGYQVFTSSTIQDHEKFSAVTKLPLGEKKYVLNCNWTDGPFIFYFRPQMQFVDLLDPSFLYNHSRLLHMTRNELYDAKTMDPSFIVKNIFSANFVLCDSEEANAMMDTDPQFKRLYPDQPIIKSSSRIALFEFIDEPISRFATRYQYKITDTASQSPWDFVDLKQTLRRGEQTTEAAIEFLDFAASLKTQSALPDCIRVRPQFTDEQLRPPHNMLGVGGGPHLRLWLNNELLFSASHTTPKVFRKLKSFVPLTQPLKKEDHLELEVCSDKTVPRFGVAASLWHKDDIQERCKDKGHGVVTTAVSAKYQESEPNCLGDIALLTRH